MRKLVSLWVAVALLTAPGCRLPGQPPAWWLSFTDPINYEREEGLVPVGQFERGKIPVILVHGLLSEPETWSHMIAGLKADPVIASRYQFWLFRYPTGESYLKSATLLRRDIAKTIAALDPRGDDRALRKMVLVGHSMGGLLCKLQVTQSRNDLWNVVFKTPFEQLQADAATKAELRSILFFEPQPSVERVVFIATPHRGSDWGTSWIGQLGASLVRFPDATRQQLEDLVQKNPSLKSTLPSTTIPTSVDHLAANNPVVLCVRGLKTKSDLKMHSIVAVKSAWWSEASDDGVVSFESAHLPEATSELVVPAPHVTAHINSYSIQEVRRILLRHLGAVRR